MENREFKGVWFPKKVYLSKEVCWSAKIIFLEIDSFTSKGKDCFFSNEYLAEFVGVSPSQVSRLISQLIKIGWVEQTRFDGRRRYLKSCLVEYKEESEQSSLADKSKADYAKSARLGTHEPQDSISEKRKHNNTINNTINNTNTSKGENAPAEVVLPITGEKKEKEKVAPKEKDHPDKKPDDGPSFENFWNAYDKKVDRLVCERMWRVLKTSDKEAIMKYVPGYVASTPDKQKRKNPETFLNRRAWENELIIPGFQTQIKTTVYTKPKTTNGPKY